MFKVITLMFRVITLMRRVITLMFRVITLMFRVITLMFICDYGAVYGPHIPWRPKAQTPPPDPPPPKKPKNLDLGYFLGVPGARNPFFDMGHVLTSRIVVQILNLVSFWSRNLTFHLFFNIFEIFSGPNN